MTIFVLVPSPLVGASTWHPVRDALRERGVGAVVPELADRAGMGPFWRQHALSIGGVIQALPAGRPIVLVGHSGAGPLLPAARQLGGRSVDAYLFVDAGMPADGMTRLELLRSELPAVADGLTAHLRHGGRYPEWSDADLVDAVPDAEQRARLLAALRPRAIEFWQEPIPVPDTWPDASCAFIRLGDGYNGPAGRARRDGWIVVERDLGHFGILTDPEAVTDDLLTVSRAAGITIQTRGTRA